MSNESKVVNVKVVNLRPKYNNLKEWMEDSNNVYIGRKGIVFIDGIRFPKHNSPFANIYKVGKDGNLETVLDKYEKYITEKLKKEKELMVQFQLLRGKKLGCWCSPSRCHGDVLISLLNNPLYLIPSQKENNESENNNL